MKNAIELLKKEKDNAHNLSCAIADNIHYLKSEYPQINWDKELQKQGAKANDYHKAINKLS